MIDNIYNGGDILQKGIFGSNSFINNEDIYENYLYFPHRFRKVKYNYGILTDYAYRNIRDRIVPALKQLYIKANYNKDTRKMFKVLKPLLIELYQIMDQYFDTVKQFDSNHNTILEIAEEKYKRNLMNDLNNNVDSIIDYINNMIDKLDFIINYNHKSEEDIDYTYFIPKFNHFNRIKIMNELDNTKLKELSHKEEY